MPRAPLGGRRPASLGGCVQRRRLGDDESLEQRDDFWLTLGEPGEQLGCLRMIDR
jgi:hypothetical protein